MKTMINPLKLSLIALCAGALASQAADATWTGANSANWNDAGNWSPGLPAAGDTLIFDAAGSTSPNNDITDGIFGGIFFPTTSQQYFLGGNAITLDSATVVNSNTVLQTLGLPIVLTNSVTINTVSNLDTTVGDITVAAAVSGPGSLIKNGGGTLTFAGTNTFSGGTTISNGLLVAATDNGNYTMSGGSLLIQYGSWYSPRNILFTTNASVGIQAGSAIYNAHGRYDLYGNIGAPGFLWTKFGDGRIQIQGGANHVLSPVYILEGVLSDGNSGNAQVSGLGTNIITVENGAALRKNNGGIVLNPIELNGGAGPNSLGALVAGQEDFAGMPTTIVATFSNTITLNSESTLGAIYGTMAIPGNITGSAGFTKVGNYPLFLGGSNTYAGNTTVNAGLLQLGSATAWPGGGVFLSVNNAATFDLAGNSAGINNLLDDGQMTASIDNSSATSATLTLTNGSFVGTVKNTGAGTLSIVCSGSVGLLGVNTYTGSTIVQSGTLDLSTPTGSASGALVIADDATLSLHRITPASTMKTAGATIGTSGATTLNIDLANYGNPSVTVINATNGSGVLAANGTLTINFNNTANMVVGQFPIIKYTSRTGTGSFVLNPLGGGIVAQIVTNVPNKSIDLQITSAPITTWKGSTTNNLWDLTTTNWTYSGSPVLYSDGSGVLLDDTALTNIVDLTSAFYPSSAIVSTTNTYRLTGSGSLASGDLTKNGSGTLILATANSYNNTTISAGTLQVGDNDLVGSLGSGTVNNSGTLSFKRADNITISSAISGTGVVAQDNTNITTISVANTYTGGTLINQGVLKLGSATALGVPATGVAQATVASGASLDVNGQMAAATNFVVISGNGVAANKGALFASAGQGCDIGCSKFGVRTLSLASDASIGNDSASFSIGNSISSPAGSWINGNGYTLTKIGNNTIVLSSVAGTAPLQFVIAGGGVVQTAPNPIGGTIVISNNAWLDMFDNINNSGFTLTNSIIIGAGGGQILNTRGAYYGQAARNIYPGSVTLNGDLIIQNTSTYGGAPNNIATSGTLTFNGPISGAGGISCLNRIDYTVGATRSVSTVSLNGVNSYNGATVVNYGLLNLSTVQQGGGAYTNNDTSVLDVPSQNGFTTVPMSTLALMGTTNGATLSLTRLTSISTSNAPITATNLVLTGTNAVLVPVMAFATAGQYPLIKYTTLTGTIDNLALGAAGARGLPGYLSNNVANSSIDLIVPGGAPVLWTGISSTTWDIDTTANWKTNGVATTYLQGDAVTFDDSTTVTNVALSVPVSPSVVIVNTTNTYTFTGTNITGSAALLKSGSGVLILTNRNNNFTGGVGVSGGTLKLGSGLNNYNSGTVTVNANATFDMQSNNPTAMSVIITGAGVGGNGAFQANYPGAAQAYGPSIINLKGNATIGGNNRMDLRNGSKQLNAANPNTTLTKTGTGYLGLVGATVSTNIADIYILNGTLSMQTSTTGLGATNADLYIGNGGKLSFYEGTVPIVKNSIVCSNGAAIQTESSAAAAQNTINTPINIVAGATVNFNFGGGQMNIAGPVNIPAGSTLNNNGNFFKTITYSNVISGSGNFGIQYQTYVWLAASNTFSGQITVPNCNSQNGNRGTRLSLVGNGSITKASQIYMQGIASGQAYAGWIALEGRPDATLTLGANQLFRGDNGSYVRGSVVAPATSAIAPGGINNSNYQYMIIGTNLTLQAGSTNYMDIYKTASLRTNDLIIVSNLVTYGGTLQIRTNGPAALVIGDTFRLFQSGSVAGNFDNIADSSGTTWSFNPATGIATVTGLPPTVNTNSTNIVVTVSGSTMELQWPADHIGWILQSNSVGLDTPGAWGNVLGSDVTNKIIINFNPAMTNVFYRMKY